MSSKTVNCVYCHSTLAGKHHADPVHPHVCDLCVESIRTNRRPLGVPEPTDLEPPPGERESKQRKGRKVKAVATALVFMLLPLAGCTLHRECTLDITVDPSFLRGSPAQLEQPPPETTIVVPTES